MKYLTVNDVILINQMITQQNALIRDVTILDGALNRPKNAAFYEQADISFQAVLCIDGILMGHAFVDGNKRSALIAGIVFLKLNGYTIVSQPIEFAREIESLVINRNINHFLIWIHTHIRPIAEKITAYIAKSERYDRFAFATKVYNTLVAAGQKEKANELLDKLDTIQPSTIENVAEICRSYVQITYKLPK